ncbi:hypothetical protein [Parageobacillus thermoglucosidasius]|uniref:Uncharacterized protein n=1 Tax=Parageobacillus thermoglucosidasius TaxID=1426 RepID=A0AB38R5Z6_PARTM|nr:hypothetical protein [Parageobacillus thermoglucosidasius]UOE78417.1 hypothetical protein IMI45_20175 [Parageobacillus thermoglucosidasius]
MGSNNIIPFKKRICYENLNHFHKKQLYEKMYIEKIKKEIEKLSFLLCFNVYFSISMSLLLFVYRDRMFSVLNKYGPLSAGIIYSLPLILITLVSSKILGYILMRVEIQKLSKCHSSKKIF